MAEREGWTAPSYACHIPERTLLWVLVQAHYPGFLARLDAEQRSLPACVLEELEAFLRCGSLDQGSLGVPFEHCHAERMVAFSCKKRGFCARCGPRRGDWQVNGGATGWSVYVMEANPDDQEQCVPSLILSIQRVEKRLAARQQSHGMLIAFPGALPPHMSASQLALREGV